MFQLAVPAADVSECIGRQLTTFNHQGIIMIGGKADVDGRPVAAYQGTIAGYCLLSPAYLLPPRANDAAIQGIASGHVRPHVC